MRLEAIVLALIGMIGYRIHPPIVAGFFLTFGIQPATNLSLDALRKRIDYEWLRIAWLWFTPLFRNDLYQ